MNLFTGLQNFLNIINDNWTTILVCMGLIMSIITKTQNYLTKSNNEKIAIAKSQIRETILKMVTKAEIDYKNWNKVGSIKRSQVIEEIFTTYPILSKIVNQTDLIKWIDNEIDNALNELRNTVKVDKAV